MSEDRIWLAVVFSGIIFVIAIFWLVFPLFVYHLMKKQIQRLEKIEHILQVSDLHHQQTADSTHKLAQFFDGRRIEVGHHEESHPT